MLVLVLIVMLFLTPISLLILVYKKRCRLFYNSHFTAETVWLNFQNQDKRRSIEMVQYKNQEKEEDDLGELK